jgi:outer membrane protein TolC
MSLSACIDYALANHPDIKIARLQVSDADWRIKENKATGLPQISASLSYSGFLQRGGLPASALQFGGGGGDSDVSGLETVFSQQQVDSLVSFLGSLFESDPDSKIFFSPVHSISGSLQWNQLLFNNSYLIGLRAARHYQEYVNDQLAVVRQNIRNQVTDAYLPALLLSENFGIADKNIRNLEKLLSETKAINQAGFAEQLDVDRLELSLANLRTERDALARQREIVVNALKFTMGMPVLNNIDLSDNLNGLLTGLADADLIATTNYMNRPEYVSLLKGRELNALQVDLFQKPWMPTVSGFVQYQPGLQGGFGAKDAPGFNKWYFIPSAVAGLSVNIPIYDGGGTRAKKERAIIAVQTIDAQKQLLENAIDLEVENARKQYLNAKERIASQQKNLDLAQRIYDTTQTKYKAGVGSSFEITQAEQALFTAQQYLIQAQYDLLTAKTALRKALGANN